MSVALRNIPSKHETPLNHDNAELEIFLNKVRTFQDNAPYGGLYVSNEWVGREMPTYHYQILFDHLDRIFYNIGSQSQNYKEMLFYTANTYIPLSIDKYDFKNAAYGAYLLKSQKYDSKTEYLYDTDVWTELKAVSLGLQENSRHYVKTLKSEHTLLILTNYVTWEMLFKIKALQCTLFKEHSLTYNQDVVDIYTAFVNKDLDTVNALLNKILDYPIWKEWQLNKIRTCFTSSKERQLETYENKIEQARISAEDAENIYKNRLKKLQECLEYYAMLENSEDNFDVDEVLDYIGSHRYIKAITTGSEQTQIGLTIEAPIQYYDTDYIEGFRGFTHDDMKCVMHEVFLKGNYKLWTHCKIWLDTDTFRTSTGRIGDDGGPYLGHPHIDRYSCQGNHTDEIRRWLQNYDYIGCIEQIMAMVYNLNWTDGIVIKSMFEHILENANKPIFEDVKTKEFVSYNTILERIKQEEH